jgi:hypothetical protein
MAGVQVVGAGHQAVAGVVAANGPAGGFEVVAGGRLACPRQALRVRPILHQPARLQAKGELGE